MKIVAGETENRLKWIRSLINAANNLLCAVDREGRCENVSFMLLVASKEISDLLEKPGAATNDNRRKTG